MRLKEEAGALRSPPVPDKAAAAADRLRYSF